MFLPALRRVRYFDDISRPAALYGITEGGRERFAYRANAVGSGRRVVLESAPRVGGFAVRRKPPTLSKLFPALFASSFRVIPPWFSEFLTRASK